MPQSREYPTNRRTGGAEVGDRKAHFCNELKDAVDVLDTNSLINLYRAIFPSRELSGGNKSVLSFIDTAERMGNNALDRRVLDVYKGDPYFVEKQIICYVLASENIDLNIHYLSLYSQQMNASGETKGDNQIIFVDELLQYTMLSFFTTVYSFAHDRSTENTARCLKNCRVLLDVQGEQRAIGEHAADDLDKIFLLPTDMMHLAMDTYWTAWTFIICHELYHLINKQTTPTRQDEIAADQYGYQLLMKMILAQKAGKMPKDIAVFYEHLYLAPVMLMGYYDLLDNYRASKGITTLYHEYPSPSERQERLFELFDVCVPDGIDTVVGNDLLNTFLDAIDIFREHIIS